VNKKEILFSETMVRSTVKFNFQQLLDKKRLLRLRQGFGGQAAGVYSPRCVRVATGKKPD
jgi:hypothetical protein